MCPCLSHTFFYYQKLFKTLSLKLKKIELRRGRHSEHRNQMKDDFYDDDFNLDDMDYDAKPKPKT